MAAISRKLLILILFYPLFVLGQNHQLEGFVHDNHVPLSFVSISVKSTTIGTVSNAEGKFKLVVPQQYSKYPICISLLGYKTIEVGINDWEKVISLEKSDFMLSEVFITPDDSMIRLMKRAVERIPENYLQTPTRQSGFYRTMLLADTIYQYFGEALLDVFKPSYNSKETGSVKILKSRINRGKEDNDMPALYFYGGIYLPFLADFVQKKEAFLDPSNFKEYVYSIDEILEQDGNKILKIAFTPKFTSKGQYKGFFYLDKNTLAFLDFNISFTQNGCEKRSKSLRANLKSKSGSYILKYAITENHYFLKYLLYTEEFQDVKSGKTYTKTNEYLTTEIKRENTTPIPLQEQDMLSTVFSVRATSVSESEWEDYTMLTKEPVQLAYSEQQSKQILEQNKSTSNLYSKGEKLITIVSRLYSSVYLDVAPTNYPEGETTFFYRPAAQHSFQLNKPIDQVENQMNLGMSLGYNLSNRFSVFGAQEISLNKNKWEAVTLGISYNIGLKNYGKRLLLSPELSIASTNYGAFLGEYDNSGSFRAGGKKFNSDKIKLYAGEQTISLQPGITIKKDLSRGLKLFLGAEYNLKLTSRDLLYIQESSGFSLFRKKTSLSSNDPDISFKNSQSTGWSNAFSLSTINFKVGIIFGR